MRTRAPQLLTEQTVLPTATKYANAFLEIGTDAKPSDFHNVIKPINPTTLLSLLAALQQLHTTNDKIPAGFLKHVPGAVAAIES